MVTEWREAYGERPACRRWRAEHGVGKREQALAVQTLRAGFQCCDFRSAEFIPLRCSMIPRRRLLGFTLKRCRSEGQGADADCTGGVGLFQVCGRWKQRVARQEPPSNCRAGSFK